MNGETGESCREDLCFFSLYDATLIAFFDEVSLTTHAIKEVIPRSKSGLNLPEVMTIPTAIPNKNLRRDDEESEEKRVRERHQKVTASIEQSLIVKDLPLGPKSALLTLTQPIRFQALCDCKESSGSYVESHLGSLSLLFDEDCETASEGT